MIIYGHNAVIEAIKAKKRKVEEIFCTKNHIDKYKSLVTRNTKITMVNPNSLDQKFGSATHQGVYAKVEELDNFNLEDVFEANTIVMLENVTDPQNLGAIIRSANGLGASAVIVPRKNSAGLTATTIKAASGAVEYTPVITVNNLKTALNELKLAGFKVLGLSGYAKNDIKTTIADFNKNQKIAIVMGAEGAGLSSNIINACDYTIKLPIVGEIESYNVSVAAALALYDILNIR